MRWQNVCRSLPNLQKWYIFWSFLCPLFLPNFIIFVLAPKSYNPTEQRKRPRTAFSQDQVRSLETEFSRNKYLTVGRRVELSKDLGLTENQVCFIINLMEIL